MPQSRKKQMKAHHGWYVVIMVTGWLVPPLAVLMRFGVGRDFFINIILTCCGYIPGHVHNFYLQNIRNNKGRGRTPKWAIKAGLVRDHAKREAKEREWANRYGQNHGQNTYDDDGYEDEFGNHVPASNRSGGQALERAALERQRQKRTASQEDGLDHNLYGPMTKVNNGDASLNGDRDPSHFTVAGFDMLPGAGDQAKRGESKSIKQLMGRDKPAKDRFAKMEDGRQHYGSGEPEAGNEDWLNQDPLSGPRTTASQARSRDRTDEPTGENWLHQQDIYQSSMAQGERRRLERPNAARQESDRLVDTAGDLHHSF